MTALEEKLARFRIDADKRNPVAKPEEPEEELSVKVSSLIIASFDQAIAKTGWVALKDKDILNLGKITTEQVASGFEDILQRATELYSKAQDIIAIVRPDIVVHEMPIVQMKKKGMHSDSPVVAATAIRCAALSMDVPVMQIQNQSAKLHLTGNRGATKADIKKAVDALYPDVKGFNEDNRDALALALKAQVKLDEGNK